MSETIPIHKHYGKTLKINGDIDVAGAILSDVKMTPIFEVTTIDQGNVPKSATRTLKGVEVSATATMLKETSLNSVETAIETFTTTRVPAEGLAPSGGSTIVELGETSITPGEAQTVSVKATYYPSMAPQSGEE